MLNENAIELAFIDQLVGQGYTYYFGPDIAPYGKNPQRKGFDSVILEKQLKIAIQKLNPEIPEAAKVEALADVLSRD